MTRKNYLTLLLLYFPSLIISQNSEKPTTLSSIQSKITRIDSLANFVVEDVENGLVIWSHGNMQRELLTQTRFLEKDGQLQRICHRERKPETDEDLSLYFDHSKLIYAELTVYTDKKKSTTKIYYENELPVFPENDDEAVRFLIKAEQFGNRKK